MFKCIYRWIREKYIYNEKVYYIILYKDLKERNWFVIIMDKIMVG